MTKVKVTREVAEAIEKAKYTFNLGAFVEFADEASIARSKHTQLLRREFDKEALLQAVFYGYEIEKTPEEKVAEYYESFGRSPSALERKFGVIDTLEILGIQIEGVNA